MVITQQFLSSVVCMLCIDAFVNGGGEGRRVVRTVGPWHADSPASGTWFQARPEPVRNRRACLRAGACRLGMTPAIPIAPQTRHRVTPPHRFPLMVALDLHRISWMDFRSA